MVLLGVVLRSPVALQAKIIAFPDQFDAVHVMAIAATHVVAVHFALGERAIYVDFVLYLAISKVKAFAQQAGQVSVQQVCFGMCVVTSGIHGVTLVPGCEKEEMARFLTRRVVTILITVGVISVIVFFLARLASDPRNL